MENDELARYLNLIQSEDCYRVESVLKESALEVTEKVNFIGANGAVRGPYVRKIIRQDPKDMAAVGAAYERIFAAQRNGRRFKHLPLVLECYHRDDRLVVIEEFVQGETLLDFVYRRDPSLKLAQSVFPALCDATTELHRDFAPPLIHRDLKPSNVILSEEGLTIIDFGIARSFRDGAATDTSHFGTRPFAPPEQFGFGQTTERSDVYALGMLLYFCLTETIPDTLAAQRGFDDPRMPAALRPVLAKATAFDPNARFESAQALRQAFLAAAAIAEHPNEATPPMPQTRQGDTSGACQGDTPNGTPLECRENPRLHHGVPLGVSPWHAPDVSPWRAPHAPGVSPFRIVGLVWNIILAMSTLVCLAACISLFFDPRDNAANWPKEYLAYCYLAFMPALLLMTALTLADKRPLARRFPFFARRKWWQWILAWVVFFLVGAVLLSLVGTALKAG